MAVQVRLRKFIAVGQKSKDDPGPYGQGYNYVVEAAFAWSPDLAHVRKSFADVLKEVDHRHLGLDVHLIEDPTTANLCQFIMQGLRERGVPALEVRLERGDGLIATGKDL